MTAAGVLEDYYTTSFLHENTVGTGLSVNTLTLTTELPFYNSLNDLA